MKKIFNTFIKNKPMREIVSNIFYIKQELSEVHERFVRVGSEITMNASHISAFEDKIKTLLDRIELLEGRIDLDRALIRSHACIVHDLDVQLKSAMSQLWDLPQDKPESLAYERITPESLEDWIKSRIEGKK